MSARFIKSYIYCFFLLSPGLGMGQNIAIDDSLGAHADMYKVKLGSGGFGKVVKISFGDYAVTASKSGAIKTKSKANLLATKKESKTTQDFSFVLSHKSGIAASVNASTCTLDKWQESFQLFPNFYIGDDKTILDSSNFTSYILLHQDTSQKWSLFMILSVSSDTAYVSLAILTNGMREIYIMPVTSNRYGNDHRALPAEGYEFVEGDQAIGALQYFGGGMWGMNKYIVWIHHELDPEMKLLLAAAMTAVMEAKIFAMME